MVRIILLIGLLFSVQTFYSQANIKVGGEAPEIHITDWLKNKPSELELDDKYVVLDFWATWCIPCLEMIPHINELQKKFADENIVFMSMTNESKAMTERTLQNHNFQTIVVSDQSNKTLVNFGDGAKGLAYYPMVVLIDPDNIIRWYGEPKNLTSDMMENLLTGKRISAPQMSMDGPLHKVMDRENLMNQEFSLSLWSDMFMDPTITYITYIEENTLDGDAKMNDATMGNGAFLHNEPLPKILKNLFPKSKIQLPKDVYDKRYNFYFIDKELSSDSYDMILKDVAAQLGLKLTTAKTKGQIFIIEKGEEDLLSRSENNKYASTKWVDGMLEIKNQNLKDLAYELTINSDAYWEYNGKDTRKYRYTINFQSIEKIKDSLEKYGLKVISPPQEIELISLEK